MKLKHISIQQIYPGDAGVNDHHTITLPPSSDGVSLATSHRLSDHDLSIQRGGPNWPAFIKCVLANCEVAIHELRLLIDRAVRNTDDTPIYS